MRFNKSKLLMITGTTIIASTLLAGTALASSNPSNNTSSNKPVQKSISLMVKDGSGTPVTFSASTPEMLKTQVDSLLKSGKITQQMADKILSSNPADGKRLADNKKSLSIVIKNGSGDPISLSASSPETLKAQVESSLKSGKITQQMANKILNSLTMIQSGKN